jgi:hypothetical protein
MEMLEYREEWLEDSRPPLVDEAETTDDAVEM